MAKLGIYYGLCPLIDHRSLLGISQDEENGVVIVTLGKNIAIKYKLLDQKQLHSWRTKEKFSSPIIFDKQQAQYVAVFNESFLRTWSGDQEFLDKLKKFKFNQQIHTIFACNEKSFIVFRNGSISPLKDSIENRKDLVNESVIDANTEYISDVLYTNLRQDTYVGLVVTSPKGPFLYWTKFNEANQFEKFHKFGLQRENMEMKGYLFHVNKISVNFLSLWSDGRIYSKELKESDLESTDVGELFTVIESISCKEYVSMTALDQNYIAMYGCNPNEEGALLVIYNVQFRVVQSRQSFKLFTNGARIWRINGNLFFPVGQNLAVVPFYLDLEQLAALVGSHKVIESEPDPDVAIVQKVQVANWCKYSKSREGDVPEVIKLKIQDFVTQGLSESMIFETFLPELFEQKNVTVLSEMLCYFTNIPENSLGKILKFILTLEPDLFKDSTLNDSESFPKSLQPLERTKLLDLVLAKPFNEPLLVSHLRTILSLDDVLMLLQYVQFLLSEDGHCFPSHSFVETEAKLINWSCILLDANYQKFLLTRDDRINEVLLSLKSVIQEELGCFESLRLVASLLQKMSKGQGFYKTVHLASLDYSIEDFPLY